MDDRKIIIIVSRLLGIWQTSDDIIRYWSSLRSILLFVRSTSVPMHFPIDCSVKFCCQRTIAIEPIYIWITIKVGANDKGLIRNNRKLDVFDSDTEYQNKSI